jgi:hypothetical protein
MTIKVDASFVACDQEKVFTSQSRLSLEYQHRLPFNVVVKWYGLSRRKKELEGRHMHQKVDVLFYLV